MGTVRAVLISRDSISVLLFCGVFIGLNILDGWLTGVALELGSYELNPLLRPTLGSNLLFKGLISVVIVLVLTSCNRGKLLKPLSAGMALVCVWNAFAIWSWN